MQDGYVFEMICDDRSVYWIGVEGQDVKSGSIPILNLGPGLAAFGTESIGTKIKVLLTPYLMIRRLGKSIKLFLLQSFLNSFFLPSFN